jgi:hypothetical protein
VHCLPQQTAGLKEVTFLLYTFITILIRFLSSFSGHITSSAWSSLIWNSNSPGKGAWLWLLCECGCWSWTYLGFVDDYHFDPHTQLVYSHITDEAWNLTPKPIFHAQGYEYRDLSHPTFPLGEDIAVRLSYIHLIDNTIHIIWLRYFTADAPYTAYVNNSEILTILLFATLVVYTAARIRIHVYYVEEEPNLLIDIKSEVPIPILSATRNLLTFTSPQHRVRAPSIARQSGILLFCLVTICTIATSDYEMCGIFILCCLLVVCGILADMKKMDKESPPPDGITDNLFPFRGISPTIREVPRFEDHKVWT